MESIKDIANRKMSGTDTTSEKSAEEIAEKERMERVIAQMFETAERWNNQKADPNAKSTTDMNCPVCRGKGMIMIIKVINDYPYEYFEKCSCLGVKTSMERIANSGLAEEVERKTFENFETITALQKSLKEMAMEFCRQEKGGLFLGGQSGAGKTHLGTAVVKTLMDKGYAAKYMVWMDEAPRLKALVNEAEDYHREINKFKRAHVLYIDDLWKTKDGADISAADLKLALEIINYRCVNKDSLITIISSENTFKEILYIDQATAGRIEEMCGEFKSSIKKTPANNYRFKKG